jgi:hypothetical protein
MIDPLMSSVKIGTLPWIEGGRLCTQYTLQRTTNKDNVSSSRTEILSKSDGFLGKERIL